MTLYEFNQLNDAQKYIELFATGTFILNKENKISSTALYCVSDFYVTISYNKADNSISEIKAFKSMAALEPYLDGLIIK